ncbi:MAG: alpha/beta hydrolase [Chitinophagaceae bacterium]
MQSTYCFILPGLNNSGPEHWQTYWEQRYNMTRIQQRDWDAPVEEEWTETIEKALQNTPLDKVVLIAHSLACCTVVKWAERYQHTIKGALLVGPSDTEAPSYPPGTTGFTPMPLYRLSFPSIVVASSNDFYVSMERARFFANNWGSKFVEAGALGHINASSGIGDWPQGYTILQTLI